MAMHALYFARKVKEMPHLYVFVPITEPALLSHFRLPRYTVHLYSNNYNIIVLLNFISLFIYLFYLFIIIYLLLIEIIIICVILFWSAAPMHAALKTNHLFGTLP